LNDAPTRIATSVKLTAQVGHADHDLARLNGAVARGTERDDAARVDFLCPDDRLAQCHPLASGCHVELAEVWTERRKLHPIVIVVPAPLREEQAAVSLHCRGDAVRQVARRQ
jgi:hypothetical protein